MTINERTTTHPEVDELIRSNWADRTAYGIAGSNPVWHNYVADLAQEARLVMWRAAENYIDDGGSIIAYCKQRGRWAILGVVSGQHNFTGGERAVPVAQKRGDDARARLLVMEQELLQALGREPTTAEVANALGITERTVYKQRVAIKNLPGQSAAPHIYSLEELLTNAGNEGALGSGSDAEAAALAYHYREIHEALAGLSESAKRYVWLRFWEGWNDADLRKEGLYEDWGRIRPVLAERLEHLIGVIT